MKKAILLLTIILFIGISESIGQSIYNDVSFLRTINNCWRVSNSFEKFRKSRDSKSSTIKEDRNKEITYVKKLLPCIKDDFEKFKLQFPNEDAIKTLEQFIKSTEKIIQDLSDDEWNSKPPIWEMSSVLGQMSIEDLMVKGDCK